MKYKPTAADVTDDLEKSLSASLNFLFLLSPLLFVFLENMLFKAKEKEITRLPTQQSCKINHTQVFEGKLSCCL